MELKNYIMYKKISTLIFSFLLFTVCFSNSLEFDEDIYVEIENCELNYGSKNLKEQSSKNEIYIVGHAYGKPGVGNFFPERLTDYFDESVNNSVSNYIALTGDFVRKPTKSSYEKVKKYLEQNFYEYFLSVGNHEINNGDNTSGEGLDNYFEYFKKDLFYKEFQNFLVISANFSNNNWLPSESQKRKINTIINNSSKKYIILLSHQLFWLLDADVEIKPNSDALLQPRDYYVSLSYDSLSWIDKSNEKYFIVISGDYGVWGDRTYCKSIDNKLFIANGIGDNPNDTIIKIFDYNKGFAIQELELNKVD